MKLRYFCGIGAELKKQRIDFDYMNQIYLYVLSGTETLAQVTTANFFNEVATSLQPNDIIFIYKATESLYTPYKVIKDLDNNVTLSVLSTNEIADIEDEIQDIIEEMATFIKADGSVPMADEYTPTADQEVATKKYVDDNAGLGNLLSDGSIPMDLAYTPTADQEIATKKYVDDEITGIGLGDLAYLDSVGSSRIDTGAIGTDELNKTSITGQTEATIASGDSILFSDADNSGNLKKTTVQGIVDVTTGQIFGGTTVTPVGTEIVALSDGTKTTTQSIADLGGGGGVSVTSQTLQATTITVDGNFFQTALTKNIIDGKILQVRRATSTNYPLLLSVLTVATDGTISFGAETSYAEGTDKLSVSYSSLILSDLVKLSATKFLLMFVNETDFSLNVALLTLDTTANTVVVENSYIVLDETDVNGFMTQGAKIIGVDGTTAIIVYQSGATASSTTKGKVITLASATTLSLGSEQTIFSNASYNGQYIQGLASPYANHFIITGFNTDAGSIRNIPFTRSGNTLAILGSMTSLPNIVNGTTVIGQITGLISYAKNKVLGNIFTNGSATAIASIPAISQGMGIVVENLYNINATSFGTVLSPSDGGGIIDMFASANTITEKITIYVETDTHVIFGYYQSAVEKIFIHNKYNGETSSVILDCLATGINNVYQIKNSIAKVRDGQYLVVLNIPTTYYLHYLPILIEGVD